MSIAIIRAAQSWMNRLLAPTIRPPAPLTCAALEQALGIRVRNLQLWRANWRNRIYRIECTPGMVLIAKQHGVSTAAEFQQEYAQLRALAQLPIPDLSMPEPIACLPAYRTYVVQAARGRSLKEIFWDAEDERELLDACACAGRVLGEIHKRWTAAVQPFPGAELAEDLARIPGGLSAAGRQTIDWAVERLTDQPVALGKL